jgi:hypothetical protein
MVLSDPGDKSDWHRTIFPWRSLSHSSKQEHPRLIRLQRHRDGNVRWCLASTTPDRELKHSSARLQRYNGHWHSVRQVFR